MSESERIDRRSRPWALWRRPASVARWPGVGYGRACSRRNRVAGGMTYACSAAKVSRLMLGAIWSPATAHARPELRQSLVQRLRDRGEDLRNVSHCRGPRHQHGSRAGRTSSPSTTKSTAAGCRSFPASTRTSASRQNPQGRDRRESRRGKKWPCMSGEKPAAVAGGLGPASGLDRRGGRVDQEAERADRRRLPFAGGGQGLRRAENPPRLLR